LTTPLCKNVSDSIPLPCDEVQTISVYRVNWLQARETYKRTREEVILVSHEMEWTVRYFHHQAERWSKRKSAIDTSGHLAYGLRMESMWTRFVTRSMEVFSATRQKFPPTLDECSTLSF
jgi:hypothetical protein